MTVSRRGFGPGRKVEAWSQQIGSTAVMVVHRGAVVAQWGDTIAKTPLASVRKSVLNALIGNAVERGQINLSQPIGQLGIDDNEPSLSAEEKSATVRDLLQARSGIYHAALHETLEAAAQRPPRFSHKPGTFWYYNNWDFNALGAIYEHASGSSIFDAFAREIAGPIGMQDYQPSDGEYGTGAATSGQNAQNDAYDQSRHFTHEGIRRTTFSASSTHLKGVTDGQDRCHLCRYGYAAASGRGTPR